MLVEAKRYRYAVTYERRDALDASSFFALADETEAGQRVPGALFGVFLVTIGMITVFFAPAVKNVALVFLIGTAVLNWSVDPAFRDFTRRLWLPRGLSLTAEFSAAGMVIERNDIGSRFTAWHEVAFVMERAAGVLLVFTSDAEPLPGMAPWYRRLRIFGDPIIWLPVRIFEDYDSKSAFCQYAYQFASKKDNAEDTSFVRRHAVTLALFVVLAVSTYIAPPAMSTIRGAINGIHYHKESVRGGPLGSADAPASSRDSSIKSTVIVPSTLAPGEGIAVGLRIAQSPITDKYYPAVSKQHGEQGTATVQLCVLENAERTLTALSTSSGFDRLDAAALRFAQNAKFEPAQLDGHAVDDCELLPVTFKLLNQ
jgi:TonB family protein